MSFTLSIESELRETGVTADGWITREATGRKTAHIRGFRVAIRIPVRVANLLWRAVRWRTR